MLAFLLALVLAVVAIPSQVRAQESAEAAVALVETYLAHHNAHDLDAVMALYAEDATFTLSMGRGVVEGREAIRELELFDVAAGSTLAPWGLRAHRHGENEWRVSFEGVVEASDVFRAAGLPIVMAEGESEGFVLGGGRILAIRQPEIRTACLTIIAGAFEGLATHLRESEDARAALALNAEGRVTLTPERLRLIVELLEERLPAARPPAESAYACARAEGMAGAP